MDKTEAYYYKMTKTPVSRLIITLGIPTTVSMLITNIYNMADTYFVGTLGESQQAATGILFTLQAIIQALSFMLGQGSGTMVSKSLADKNREEASVYVSSAFFAGISAGVVLLLTGIIFINPFMRLLGSTETILPYARQYGVCVLGACPFMVGSFILNNNLRYEGKAFYAMIGLTVGGVLNIFGDFMMIRVLPLGVLGAGLSTAVSQVIGFCILFYFYRKMAQGNIMLKYVSKKALVYATIAKIGFPALIRQGLTSVSNGILNNVTKPYGDSAIAAMSVVNRFSAFIMCVGLGIGQGFQPVASFNYQAKEYKRVKKGLLFTMCCAFCMVGMLSVLGFCFAEQIIYIFQKSEEVKRIGVFALRCAAAGVIFISISTPVNMLYQSTRKAKTASFLSLLRSGLMFLPVLYIGTHFFGIRGIQTAQPIADFLTGMISVPFIISFIMKKDEDMI